MSGPESNRARFKPDCWRVWGLKLLMLNKLPGLSLGLCAEAHFLRVEPHNESCSYVLGSSVPEACSPSVRWMTEHQVPLHHCDFLHRSWKGWRQPRRRLSPCVMLLFDVESQPSAQRSTLPYQLGAVAASWSGTRCDRCCTHILALNPHGGPHR